MERTGRARGYVETQRAGSGQGGGPLNTILGILDRIDPFSAPAEEPFLDESQARELEAIPGAEEALIAIAGDEEETPARRYAASGALLDGHFVQWRASPANRRVVAGALAVALRRDSTHNRWGLPGRFTGRRGEQLLSLSDGVAESLLPLLEDATTLHIEGSEAFTSQSKSQYRIADLAGYLLSRFLGLPWPADLDVRRRNEMITALRHRLHRI